jgi:hypothetical protein
MMCERYWREGIVLVERGLADPHREGCPDCTRAHASRQELVDALPLIGAGDTGDPDWQDGVWRRIDGERAHAAWRWRWPLVGPLAVACAIALWIGLGRSGPGDPRPVFAIVAQGELMRSTSAATSTSIPAHVDDHLRVTVGEAFDVWIYRAGRIELQCRARQVADRCTPSSDGMVVELVLSMPEVYQVIVVKAPPVGLRLRGLDDDRAALESAGILYEEHKVSVH